MRQRVPWKLKGVRPEVRDTAREAARQAGIPVAQWLDQAILARAGAPVHPPYQQHPSYPPQPARPPYPAPGYAPQGYASPPPYAAPPPYPPTTYGHGLTMPGPQPDCATDFDRAVAEIAARQQALDSEPETTPPLQPQMAPPRPQPVPPQAFAPPPPAAAPYPYLPPQPPYAPPPGPDLSGLERQLQGITVQIEKLNRRNGFAEAIGELRADLSEIGRALTEAMPRRALEALEAEVRNLAAKIEQSRVAGVDPAALASMEHGLADVREALRALTPAENLVGFEEAVRGLAQKIDQLAFSQQDPAALQQLEATIGALRGVVSHVASNDALAALSDEVRGLAAKIDRVAGTACGFGPDALVSLEQKIADLPVLGVIERGFGELKARIEDLQRVAPPAVTAPDYGFIERGFGELNARIDGLQRATATADLSGVLSGLERNFDRTQDALEALHGTLGLVVDRLAGIESAVKNPPIAASLTPPMPSQTLAEATARRSAPPLPVQERTSELAPSPAVPAPPPPSSFALPASSVVPSAPEKPREMPRPRPPSIQDRGPINPNLPPDFPLEPGSGAPQPRPKTSAADRIAASEAALAPTRSVPKEQPAATNFIAAARRAAQAAAPATPAADPLKPEGSSEKRAKTLGQRVRALIVGGSAVLVVVGTMHAALRMLDITASDGAGVVFTDPPPGFEEKMLAEEEAEERAKAASTRPLAKPPGTIAPSGVLVPANRTAAAPSLTGFEPMPDPGITGSVATRNTAAKPPAPAPAENGPALPERLPALLREAALAGDAAAEYEIGMRYLEGRGLPQNSAEALRWLERAARSGLAPAQFRLGGLYEKGQGTKKDPEAARKLYLSAAEKGNAKAMHNLAVLYAEGIDGKPDYKTAAIWFRKAAEYGTADSQHNLGILYARGVGVEQNLAESYKWFALAANQGDRDSANKRDEVAARLDRGSLMAAKLAVQSFVVKAQPDDAATVKMPTGGWERPAATGTRPEKKPKPGNPKRTAPS
jgi:localization factor PodJL